MADKKADFASILIIQGTAGDIDAKRVESCFNSLDGFSPLKKVRGALKEGTVCTIIVEDPIRITDATYCGTRGISGYTFLAFTKNGVQFWLFSEATAYLET